MNLVDVHCHLNHQLFKKDLEEVLLRAELAGLKTIIVSGTNSLCNREVLELSKINPLLKVTLGIHPIDALGLSEGETGIPKQKKTVDLEEEFKFIEQHKNEIIGIGEVGLDFHWDKEHRELQMKVFHKIIQFAIKLRKPLIVHTWEAEEECLQILSEELSREDYYTRVPVILHCFSGRKALITHAKELGFYFSVPPSISRLGHFQTLVKKVNLKQLLTETDAPWQSSGKGQRNEPSFVRQTVQKIAEIKGITEEKVAEQIWQNYVRIFGGN